MTSPTEDCVSRGLKFISELSRRRGSYVGEICDEQGVTRWRCKVRKSDQHRSLKNPFKTMDFVVTNLETADEVVFRRDSFLPSRFAISDSKDAVGTVCLRSFLRNKYSINVRGQQPRVFRMPLFKLQFCGGTAESPEFWVLVGPSKMEWNILIKPDVDERFVVPTLSFLHYQWWNYS